MTLINGKEISFKIKQEVKQEVDKLKEKKINPCLAVILVGDNSASQIYIKQKKKACEETGITFKEFLFPESCSESELLSLIEGLNEDNGVNGILVQLPLPALINVRKIIEAISPLKDVDGFHPINLGKLMIGEEALVSCTPRGIMRIFEEINYDLMGKKVVLINRSNIIGKPLALMLLKKHATVTICHSKTRNIKQETSGADIIITAVGKPNFITEDMIKQGAVVIDAGISKVEGKIVGDVDFENVKDKASFITPMPGGTGPLTVAMLVENVVKAAKLQQKTKFN